MHKTKHHKITKGEKKNLKIISSIGFCIKMCDDAVKHPIPNEIILNEVL